MKELAGSYIEDEDGALQPNLNDEAMKQRAEADKPKDKKAKEGKDEQK